MLHPQPSALLNTVLEADSENPPLAVFQSLYISLQKPASSRRLEQQRHWNPHPLGSPYLAASPLVFTVSGVSRAAFSASGAVGLGIRAQLGVLSTCIG